MSEYGWFLTSRWWLTRGRDGAGRPVLVLPGLEAADWSTKPLRNLLSSVGYRAYGWGLGRNVGPTERIITGLDELLLQIRDRHQAPVSVVGQSLGGLPRARARPPAPRRRRPADHPGHHGDDHQPAAVAGSQGIPRGTPTSTFRSSPSSAGLKAPQPPIPATSIYSRSDGIVHWEACQLPRGAAHREHRGLRQPLRPRQCTRPPCTPCSTVWRSRSMTEWAKFAPPAALRGYFLGSAPAAA